MGEEASSFKNPSFVRRTFTSLVSRFTTLCRSDRFCCMILQRIKNTYKTQIRKDVLLNSPRCRKHWIKGKYVRQYMYIDKSEEKFCILSLFRVIHNFLHKMRRSPYVEQQQRDRVICRLKLNARCDLILCTNKDRRSQY